MNPNRMSRDLRNLPGNVWSSRLPGGSMVAAVFDRMLMTWSDRGGASRIFGELWSEYCWNLLLERESSIIESLTGPGDWIVLRLDENPRIAIQAGRNKLPNPDFLILSESSGGGTQIRAIDAKFAIDRVRRTQISPESIRELVEIPGSLVRPLIDEHDGSDHEDSLQYERGIFLGPHSLLNDYYWGSLTGGNNPQVPASELRLVDVNGTDLFAQTPEYDVMLLFREIDQLDRSDSGGEIVTGMYYLRLACAARWFEQQLQAPLLSLRDPEPVTVDEVYSAAERRVDSVSSAYELILEWSESVSEAEHRQAQVRDAAGLPVRMGELRRMAELAGFGEDKRRIRMLRGSLERRFARRLVEVVGEIPASPSEPMSSLEDRVRQASNSLKKEIMDHAAILVERFSSEDSAAGEGDA
jgi:hypothetical protein